ncbi:MAG: ThiF family adenylyltransferase [Paracoccus sp. (in: a-proteobacteria)]
MNVALIDIGRAIETRWRGQRLTAEDLRSLSKGPWAGGWRFKVAVRSDVKDIDLVFDASFPWSAPRLYMRRPPALGSLPHVEADGLICAFPSRTPMDPANPVGIAHAYLKRLVELAANWSDPNFVEGEIADEYLSYLGRRSAPRPIRSLLAPKDYAGPTAYLWRGRSDLVLSNDPRHLSRWLESRYGRQTRKWALEKAVILQLDTLHDPQTLPRNVSRLLDLSDSIMRRDAIVDGLVERSGALLVAVVLPTRPHATMIAYDIPAARRKTEHGRQHVTAGFRAKRMSRNVFIQRRAGASIKIAPLEVERLDAAWVHGRDQITELPILQDKTITLIGCGSLGSGVATLLAKAGVGRMNLVDPEVLASENVSRHELGITAVGCWKADALAERLRSEFPHLFEVSCYHTRWQSIAVKHPSVLRDADLLMVAIGSWMDEGALEAWRIEQDLPPTAVYGWLEPHATAAHAVSLTPQGPCLGCGLDEFGQSLLHVSDWPDGKTARAHPACGGTFQPYGASQLAYGHGLLADLCLEQLTGEPEHIHRIWSGPSRTLKNAGGTWSSGWKDFAGPSLSQGGEFEHRWSSNRHCRICKGER